MKRILTVLCCLLFLCGCVRTSEDYERGYADGYAAAMSEYARTTPDTVPAAVTGADFTVYVSRSGTMHKKPDCSGMQYYTEMSYSVAEQYYSKKCSKCFK